jgi:ABC-type branched-subunit amino acid transport system ATPase component
MTGYAAGKDDFIIDEGEIVCIIGANGAGKSTTLWHIPNPCSPESI